MKPAVLLLGIETPIGLAIIRELGERGVPVHGLGRGPHGLGRYSRHLAAAHERAPADTLVAQIRALAAPPEDWVLMAISESDIAWINTHREALGPLRCLVPSAEAMALAVDKARTLALAAETGIAVPRSFTVETPEDSARIARECRFPVVLKWADPASVMPALHRLGIGFAKFEYCHSAAELEHALQRYRPIGRYPLVQEYCRGYGLGQFVFMHEGKPLRVFQHRRLHEWPPEGGFSTLCESLPAGEHAALMERSVALLQRMNWVGPAMVEYRYDPAEDRAVLMEVNGRFWGSLPLAYHAGAGFAWLTYSVLGRGEIPALPEPRARLLCRFGLPETKRLLTILFRPEKIQDRSLRFHRGREILSFLAGLASPRMRYFVWDRRDPLPFLADLWWSLVGVLRASLRRLGA